MKKIQYTFCWSILFLFATVISSCASSDIYAPLEGIGTERISDIETDEIGAEEATLRKENVRLLTDVMRLTAFSEELERMKTEMYELREISRIWDLEYFPPEEHDKIESLLFRYLALRNSLWELIDYYVNYRDYFSNAESQTKGFLIGFSAGLHLAAYSSLLVSTFLDEPVGKSKLNEAYPRSGISEGTYNMLFSQVTSIDNLEAIKVAWVLFSNEWKDTNSTLNRIYRSDPEYRIEIERIEKLHNEAESRIQNILEQKSLLFPEITNRLRHTMINKLAEKLKKELKDNLYAARGILFSNVSDIKFPFTNPLAFSYEQKALIKSLLKPGDIILTYTAGYMSNIFLPGIFKHGITYIGTPDQRDQLRLKYNLSAIRTGIDKQKFLENISYARLDSGYQADVIEAVAEGVIFNSLDLLLDTHINRMVILSPKFSEQEKIEELITVFSLLGVGYDFKFDFNDGSYQCCTEVIYRALNSRGAFDFKLTNRMGTLTLSADDIINYYFSMEPQPFDFVLYAERDNSSADNEAIIFLEENGKTRLKELIVSDQGDEYIK